MAQWVLTPLVRNAANPRDVQLGGADLAAPCTVGRAASCSLKVEDPRYSREHCRLFVDGGRLFVQDDSTNGTFVNAARLPRREPRQLRDDDVVTLAAPHFTPDFDDRFVGFVVRSLGAATGLARSSSLERWDTAAAAAAPAPAAAAAAADPQEFALTGAFASVQLPAEPGPLGVVLGRAHAGGDARVSGAQAFVRCAAAGAWEATTLGRNACCVQRAGAAVELLEPGAPAAPLAPGDALGLLPDPLPGSLLVLQAAAGVLAELAPLEAAQAQAAQRTDTQEVDAEARKRARSAFEAHEEASEAAAEREPAPVKRPWGAHGGGAAEPEDLTRLKRVRQAPERLQSQLEEAHVALARAAAEMPSAEEFTRGADDLAFPLPMGTVSFDVSVRGTMRDVRAVELFLSPSGVRYVLADALGKSPKKVSLKLSRDRSINGQQAYVRQSDWSGGSEHCLVPVQLSGGVSDAAVAADRPVGVRATGPGAWRRRRLAGAGHTVEARQLMLGTRELTVHGGSPLAQVLQARELGLVELGQARLGPLAPTPWVPANHHLFPEEFRETALAVLLARRRLAGERPRRGLGRMTDSQLFIIFSFLPSGQREIKAGGRTVRRLTVPVLFTELAVSAVDGADAETVVHGPHGELWPRAGSRTVMAAVSEAVEGAAARATSAQQLRMEPVRYAPRLGPWARPPSGDAESCRPPASDQFDLFQLLECTRPSPLAPEQDTPAGMRSPLLPFQRRALRWLCAVESGEFAATIGPRLHPAWRAYLLPGSGSGPRRRVYQSLAKPWVWTTRGFVAPRAPAGGVLADEMGLGKTIETIALIAARPRPAEQLVAAADVPAVLKGLAGVVDEPEGGGAGAGEDDDAAEMFGTRRRSRRVRNQQMAAEQGVDVEELAAPDPVPIKATLIVCPATIANQWDNEISRHAPDLRVTRFNGVDFKTWAADLLDYDVVLASYETLRKDLRNFSSTLQSPVLHVQWWRVILDEAQVVTNTNSAAAQMCSVLPRMFSWCVSGTPISNRIKDLAGLVSFLGLEPFDEPGVFRRAVVEQYEKGSAAGLQLVRGILQTCTWRHRKAHVEHEVVLPPCLVASEQLALSPLERGYYDRRYLESRRALQEALARTGALALNADVMAMLLHLRQTCCHPQIVRRSDQLLGGGEKLSMHEIMRRLVRQAQHAFVTAERDRCRALVRLAVAPAAGVDPVDGVPMLERAIATVEGFVRVLWGRWRSGSGSGSSSGSDGSHGGEIAPLLAGFVAEQDQHEEEVVRPWLRLLLAALEGFRDMCAAHPYLRGRPDQPPPADAAAAALPERLAGGGALPARARWRNPSALADDVGRLEALLQVHEEAAARAAAAEAAAGRSMRSKAAGAGGAGAGAAPAAKRARRDPTGELLRETHARAADAAVAAAHDLVHLSNRYAEAVAAESSSSSSAAAAGAADASCPLCLELVDNAAVTPCGHVFCRACLEGLFHDNAYNGVPNLCPICRAAVDPDAVLKAAAASHDEEADDVHGEYGTKISALVQLLKRIARDHPGAKSVVFSQWSRLLRLVMDALADNGVRFAFLSGTRRESELSNFRLDDECTVLLVPMRTAAGAAGLTLTNSRFCFLLEPSLNFGLEDQAIGRLHRIGQKQPVTVFRLLVGDTIEERIMELQARKRRLTDGKKATARDEKEKLQTEEVLEIFGLGSVADGAAAD